ncbi:MULTISPECIES: hypothetical protein [Neisseria]|uniref:hypothetical protein n=1 Tax=Neisseria TaxID=482 RepID=UPI00128FF2E4|nr:MULTISPECIES: hypothetical protein [Neisseria]
MPSEHSDGILNSGIIKSIFSPSDNYSGLNLNQDKATKPQTVQIVRQGEATPYWFLLIHYKNGFRKEKSSKSDKQVQFLIKSNTLLH